MAKASGRRLLNVMLEKIMIMEPESCCEEMVLWEAGRTRGGSFVLTVPISPLLVSNCYRGSEMPGIRNLSLSSRYARL